MAKKRKKSKRKCVIYYPTLKTLLNAVERLKQLYPEDRIHVVSRSALEDAISAAKFAATFTRGSCREKKLVAVATLFYEIITRHPLSDGNKRLATVMLAAFLKKNSSKTPRPGGVWRVAVYVATGEWDAERTKRWLERIQHK